MENSYVEDVYNDNKSNNDKNCDNKSSDNKDNDNKNNDNTKSSSEISKVMNYGQVTLDKSSKHGKIHLMTIIGEIEGHDVLPATSKSTKYEHILPQLAAIEDDESIKGVLFLMNTVGGDVSAGLAVAEMISSMSTPTVSLVLGDSHSIGVPLAVSTDYSFIAPTATMIVHPVRMNGTIIGAPQTFDYFRLIQDRIVTFISEHSEIKKEKLESMMINTGMLTKDLGTILVGSEAVDAGLINEVGGIRCAIDKLNELMGD